MIYCLSDKNTDNLVRTGYVYFTRWLFLSDP